MSSSVILILVILALGFFFGVGFYFLTRKLEVITSEDLAHNELHGSIGSYTEIRKKMFQSTPREYVRDEMPLIPANVVRLVRSFEDEVNNGGIDQFFFNYSGDYSQETVQSLEIIKANRMAEILREGCKLFPEGSPPTNAFLRRQLLLVRLSPKGDAFDHLDQRFYAYEDNIEELLKEYELNDHTDSSPQ